MRNKCLIYLFLIVLASPAWADDSVEAAVAGNIVFEKTPELIIQDETLIISRSAGTQLGNDGFDIDVDFHIKNISNHDVTKQIAFVLPPVQCRMDVNSMWQGLDTEDNDQINNKGLKDFSTTIDGKPQAYTTRTEALLDQRNITGLLTKIGIPLNPCKIKTTMDGRPDPRYAIDLINYHLLTEANEAAWSENIVFEWTQTFPAGSIINIHHHYTPVIGESVLSPRPISELTEMFTKNTPPMNAIWNRSPTSLNQTNPSIVYSKNDLDAGDHQKRFCLMPKWVRYQLTTGANWNGGIQSFKLIIKDNAGTPFAVNAFYEKDSGTHTAINGETMTFTIDHFIPTENLFILFLSLPKSAEDLQACGM